MQGTMLIYTAEGRLGDPPELRALSAPPTLKALQEIVGGFIEQAPYFTTISIDDEMHRCVAFSNEEGRVLNLPINQRATKLWNDALARISLHQRDERTNFVRMLVGTIVVIIGDNELMVRL